jgi:hypothetical protein
MSSYEEAQIHLGYIERAKTAMLAMVDVIASSKCPLQVAAHDLEQARACARELVTELFWEGKREAEQVIADHEARDYREYVHEHSTYRTVQGKAV